MKSVNFKLSSPLEPTRVFKERKSCLDHIYSNVPVATKTVHQTSITNHFFVFSELLATVNAKKWSQLFRDYKNLPRNDNLIKYDFHLRYQCSKIDWANIDVDEGFNKLTQCITISADKFVPQKPLLIRRKNWVTNKLKRNKQKRS